MSSFVRLGLTGGIACGKSNASAELARLGAHCIDVDQVAHETYASPEAPAFRPIVDAFGVDVGFAEKDGH